MFKLLLAASSLPALALSPMAVVEPSSPHDTQLERIIYRETGPHGTGYRFWEIISSGQGLYKSDIDRTGSADVTFNIGREGFRALREILDPLETRREITCSMHSTDQAFARLIWKRGSDNIALHVDFGCVPPPEDDAAHRIQKANLMIRRVAGVARSDE